MKVLLVALNSKFIHSNLAIRYLKAYTEDLNYECTLREFTINDRMERILEQIIKEKPDVIAFSCYIWNLEYVSKLSNLIKNVNENIEILYGGPEVSYDSKTFLDGVNGDYVINGEGEETFKEFIEYKIESSSKTKEENINTLSKIKGLAYKDNGKVIMNPLRELMDMNKIVFPYKMDEDLENKIVYYEASRGCPFNCKYCLSSTIHGVRFLDIERVKRELDFFINKKVKLIKFVDRTFNCNHKFAMAIWDHLIKADTNTTFHFEISADIFIKEELELLRKAPKDRFQFEVGVQTTNNDILKNINRHVNFENIKEKVEELEKMKNIKQHLDLIAGLPGEDYESFRNSFNDVYSIKPEEIQLGFLKLLKGSPMTMEAEKWGMKYSPYPPYEILRTNDISYEELIKLKRVEAMVDKYYNSGKFNTILKYFENLYSNSFDFYYDLGMYFYEKGYFFRNISGVDYYKVFIDFNSEVKKSDNKFLNEIVKYDYLRFNKRRWLPNFLNREELSKEEQKNVKEKLKDAAINKEFQYNNDIHIEKFNIDVNLFIDENKGQKGQYYYAFKKNDSERIFDITSILV